MIIGYRRPDKGEIWLDNSRMQELDLRSYRKFISVVPQNIILFAGTIKENILYGLEPGKFSDQHFQRVIQQAKVDEFVKNLPHGLDTFIGEHGGKLSGGQKQRIAIARALVRDPRVIILDEATSALDVESEAHVQEAIQEMIKGRTTFIVAHRLTTIKHADRIVVLNRGKIVESGSREELLTKDGVFARMVRLQS
jgi:ATP-binding cassette, subfamily B, bacterial